MVKPRKGARKDTRGAAIPPLEALAARLESALGRPLPGRAAQERMSPRQPGGDPLHPSREPDPRALPAAGLVLLYLRDSRPCFLLTVRSSDLPTHPGQVGLPAGMMDPGETSLDAALRETREEIGVQSGDLRVLGALTPIFIPPTRILLHPFVAVARRPLAFRAHAAEVARILEIPLEALLDPASIRSEPRRLQAGQAVVPYFWFEGEKIWGATAMVLAELGAVLEGGFREP